MYHVVARGTGRQIIFEDDDDRKEFLDLLQRALKHTNAKLYAWCLMSNHFHLVVQTPMKTLAKLMKELCGQYARYFNKKSGRSGHLFQERYRSEAICDEQYLLAAIRYVHNNPVKAGICPVQNYPWSSYSEYAEAPRLCNTDLVLGIVGGTNEFAQFQKRDDEQANCIDVAEAGGTVAQRDDIASEFAQELLGPEVFLRIKELERRERNRALAKLRDAGFSIRQTERLTGIGRGSIARAWAQSPKTS